MCYYSIAYAGMCNSGGTRRLGPAVMEVSGKLQCRICTPTHPDCSNIAADKKRNDRRITDIACNDTVQAIALVHVLELK